MIRNFKYLIVFTSAPENDSKFLIFEFSLALLVFSQNKMMYIKFNLEK